MNVKQNISYPFTLFLLDKVCYFTLRLYTLPSCICLIVWCSDAAMYTDKVIKGSRCLRKTTHKYGNYTLLFYQNVCKEKQKI